MTSDERKLLQQCCLAMYGLSELLASGAGLEDFENFLRDYSHNVTQLYQRVFSGPEFRKEAS